MPPADLLRIYECSVQNCSVHNQRGRAFFPAEVVWLHRGVRFKGVPQGWKDLDSENGGSW